MTATVAQARAPTFFDEVVQETPGGNTNLELCLQCGTCGGSCPSGQDMDHTPRALFGMISAGMKKQVLSSNTPWYCVSCYYCMVRCPQEIPVTDVMYTLRRMSARGGAHEDADVADFSRTFIDCVERYGRSFELELAARYHLTHSPFSKMSVGPLAIGRVLNDRVAGSKYRIAFAPLYGYPSETAHFIRQERKTDIEVIISKDGKFSLRSVPPLSHLIAREFGGGGHPNAAGGSFNFTVIERFNWWLFKKSRHFKDFVRIAETH